MDRENANILLIDDDEDVLLAAKFILKKHFNNITTVHNPEHIQNLLQTEKFDVILLDMNFSAGETSGREGFETLSLIHSISPASRVIMMTAYGDIDIAIKALKEGAFDFVVKPWDNAKLISTVIAAFKKGISENASYEISKNHQTNLGPGFSEVIRIFMFLDLRSSTTIAEYMGHIRYFELLNDFFKDITDPIANNKGEIYQYVGDEVVVTWDLEEGTSNAHCLNCFFEIENLINSLSEKYTNKYDMLPSFKAGLHFGKVSMGTVGTLKKEIVYTGDVLNTTSRLEGLCNQYDVNIIISNDLLQQLSDKNSYKFLPLGEIGLRGKRRNMIIYTVDKN